MIAETVRRAASRYVAGDTADGAAAVADRLVAEGYGSTIAYWDSGKETPEEVASEYARALEVATSVGGYVSVKATAVAFRLELLGELAGRGARLHFDAMAPETVDRTRDVIEQLTGERGTTLPGRWNRSDDDADWAVDAGLHVRVVKGQWPGPDERDPAAGFLEVVDRLAGRARSVAVATHDQKLASTALERLRARGTSCELEQLYGLRRAAAPARIYVPYGSAWLPYALNNLRRRPRAAWWLVRDLALASTRDRRAEQRTPGGAPNRPHDGRSGTAAGGESGEIGRDAA